MGSGRRNQLLLVLLVLTSVTLIAVDHRSGDDSALNALRTAAAAVFGPVEAAGAGARRAVAGAVERVTAPDTDADRLSRLKQENARLRRQLRTSNLARSRAAELDKLLRVTSAGGYRTVPAEVIAVAPAQSLSRTVTIDAGRRDGIQPDMTVLNGDGLVGRVRTVGPWTATVLLAVDPRSAVGVRLESTMEIGIAAGARASQADDALRLELLDSQATISRGDRLVTFGSRGNRPYVPGVPVGMLTDVQQTPGTLTRTATVKPYVDFTALDLVGVVVEPPRRDPRDAILPAVPDGSVPDGSAQR